MYAEAHRLQDRLLLTLAHLGFLNRYSANVHKGVRPIVRAVGVYRVS